MKISILATLFLSTASLLVLGCGRPTAEKFPDPKPNPNKAAENIIGKQTQEIEEFDPEGEDKAADLQVKPNSSPLTAIGGGATFAIAQAAKLKITQALNLFKAYEGRYPKDHDEFMTKVIKANQIQLPVLPGNRRYQYDVENHELVIVEAKQ